MSLPIILKSGAVLSILGLAYIPIEVFLKKYRKQDITEREVANTVATSGLIVWCYAMFKLADKN